MPLNGLAGTANINTYVGLANSTPNLVNPEVFYSKQLLDTIRYDADAYVYFRLADETPIQDKADKLILRRWAPLQAHTTPLTEGVPPISDKGSVEKYEISAKQYGRYMEFSDKVDFNVVDPVVAHYTREYTLVAMETLDLLAKEVLLAQAQKYYAGGAANFEELNLESKPTMTDLRMIVMAMKKALVKPRSNGRFHVIGSPEFYYDMISDPTVEKYMTINNSTETMYSNSKLVPMFDMEFYETPAVPTSGQFVLNGVKKVRVYTSGDSVSYRTEDYTNVATVTGGYVLDSRTQLPASYFPEKVDLALGSGNNHEFKAQHILIVGKDALTRTGLAGEGQAKVYVKQKGSAGVLDPIDQRQSIGFKINSVGFGSTRPEAICDYICVPSLVNTL
jgi:hypothetical protein